MAQDATTPLQGSNAGAGGTEARQQGSQPLQHNMNNGEDEVDDDFMHLWQSEAQEEAPQEARMLALADDRLLCQHMPNGEWHAAHTAALVATFSNPHTAI
jgi:hypothetical protein